MASEGCELACFLHCEVAQRNVSVITSLIQKGVNVDSPDLEDNTALHVAAAHCYLDVVIILLENGANIEAANIFGWTPLMQAARYGHESIVSVLLIHGADIEKRNKFGLTPLLLASASGHVRVVRQLLEKGASFERNVLNYQVSPMMIAALYGRDIVMKLYLDKGISANILTYKTGISPLMFAVAGGSLLAIQILIERAAKLNLLNAGKFSALDVATICNKMEVVDHFRTQTLTLQKKDDKISDIMEVTKRGDINMLQGILLSDPSKAKTVTGEGATPLMIASMMNHTSVAQLLLDYGADINAQDYINGWTPLMQAIYHRHTSLAVHLLHRGADVNIITTQGYTAFDLANEVVDVDILKIFSDFHEIQCDSTTSLSADSPNNSKIENINYPTLQPFKLLWSKILRKRRSSLPENIPKKIYSKETISCGSVGWRLKSSCDGTGLTPTTTAAAAAGVGLTIYSGITKAQTHRSPCGLTGVPDSRKNCLSPSTLTYQPIYSEIAEESKLFYTNAFLKSRKSTDKVLQSMTPPSSKSKEVTSMPAGVKESSVHFHTNALLIERNKNRCKRMFSSENENAPKTNLQSIPYKVCDTVRTTSPTPTEVSSRHFHFPEDRCGVRESCSYSGFDEILDILEKLNLQSRVNIFQEEEVDGEAFMMLSPDDFRNLGISGSQRVDKIMRAVKDIKAKERPN